MPSKKEVRKLQFYVFRITTYNVYDSLGIINELCSQRLITLEGEMCIDRTLIECLLGRVSNVEQAHKH